MPLSADLIVRRDGFVVDASLNVADGETLALLGPNGAGKSTLLEALAGLVPIESGHIELDARPLEGVPPERRPVGVAFQDGLLFPTMSALENVAFPLRARGARTRAARTEAADLLGRIAPAIRPDARPAQLSGGERQRVALARALAARPRLLLLDEPLAAVDVAARSELRSLLRDITASFAGPCILVAHDPIDALTLAGRVTIIEAGLVSQTGSVEEILRAPTTPYAAELVGVNLFAGTLEPAEGGAGTLASQDGSIACAWPEGLPPEPVSGVLAILRPADVALHVSRPEGSPRNVWEGRVIEVARHGERARVRLSSTPAIVAEVTPGSLDRLDIRKGTRVFASFKAVEVRLIVPGREPDTL
jgi:molybdate transport system ATP-binding protein